MRDTLALFALGRKRKNIHRFCRKTLLLSGNCFYYWAFGTAINVRYPKLPRIFATKEAQEAWFFFALPLNHAAISSAVTETPLSGIQTSSLILDWVNQRGLVVTLRVPLAGNSVLENQKGSYCFCGLLILAHRDL